VRKRYGCSRQRTLRSELARHKCQCHTPSTTSSHSGMQTMHALSVVDPTAAASAPAKAHARPQPLSMPASAEGGGAVAIRESSKTMSRRRASSWARRTTDGWTVYAMPATGCQVRTRDRAREGG